MCEPERPIIKKYVKNAVNSSRIIKLCKKYWWIILILALLIFLPIIVDFSYPLKRINSQDILNYLGAILGGSFTLIAVLVAIKHHKDDTIPIIVPKGIKIYYYHDFHGSSIITKKDKYAKDTIDEEIIHNISFFDINNVTDNAALNCLVRYKYGFNDYQNLCKGNLFKKSSFGNIQDKGVFSSNETKRVYFTLNELIRNFCDDAYMFEKQDFEKYKKLTKPTYKLAEIQIITENISGKNNINVFDVNMTACSVGFKEVASIYQNADFEIYITFKMHDKKNIIV